MVQWFLPDNWVYLIEDDLVIIAESLEECVRKLLTTLLLEYFSQYFDGTWKKCRTGRENVLPARITSPGFKFNIFDSLLKLASGIIFYLLNLSANLLFHTYMYKHR